AASLDADDVGALWATLRALLRAGERSGRITTIVPADRTRPPSRLRRDEALYVYRRQGLACRRCGATIEAWPLGGRRVFACPECQPPRPTG
ncbi:MAG: Fpg/Nei family DNA glycosylase, partial [Actinomycetota bacterium]